MIAYFQFLTVTLLLSSTSIHATPPVRKNHFLPQDYETQDVFWCPVKEEPAEESAAVAVSTEAPSEEVLKAHEWIMNAILLTDTEMEEAQVALSSSTSGSSASSSPKPTTKRSKFLLASSSGEESVPESPKKPAEPKQNETKQRKMTGSRRTIGSDEESSTDKRKASENEKENTMKRTRAGSGQKGPALKKSRTEEKEIVEKVKLAVPTSIRKFASDPSLNKSQSAEPKKTPSMPNLRTKKSTTEDKEQIPTEVSAPVKVTAPKINIRQTATPKPTVEPPKATRLIDDSAAALNALPSVTFHSEKGAAAARERRINRDQQKKRSAPLFGASSGSEALKRRQMPKAPLGSSLPEKTLRSSQPSKPLSSSMTSTPTRLSPPTAPRALSKSAEELKQPREEKEVPELKESRNVVDDILASILGSNKGVKDTIKEVKDDNKNTSHYKTFGPNYETLSTPQYSPDAPYTSQSDHRFAPRTPSYVPVHAPPYVPRDATKPAYFGRYVTGQITQTETQTQTQTEPADFRRAEFHHPVESRPAEPKSILKQTRFADDAPRPVAQRTISKEAANVPVTRFASRTQTAIRYHIKPTEVKTVEWDVIRHEESNVARIVVFNLATSITGDELFRKFSEFGTISTVQLVDDHTNFQRPNLAFIEFERHQDASKAVLVMAGKKLGDCPIGVDFSTEFFDRHTRIVTFNFPESWEYKRAPKKFGLLSVPLNSEKFGPVLFSHFNPEEHTGLIVFNFRESATKFIAHLLTIQHPIKAHHP